MPVWLQDPGVWIAIGISLLFVVVGLVMHRVIVRVLKDAPATAERDPAAISHSSNASRAPDHE